MRPVGVVVLLTLFSLRSYALVESPDNCVKRKSYPCLIKTQGDHPIVNFENDQLHLSVETLVELRNQEVHILRGNLWIEGETKIRFSTLYATGEVAGNIWVFASTARTEIKNLDGQVVVGARDAKSVEQIPVGFQNWFSGPQNQSKVITSGPQPSLTGVLEPLEPTRVLSGWIKAFRPSDKIMREFAVSWVEQWHGNVNRIAEVYQVAADRHVASVRGEELRAAQVRKRREEENAKLRAMFRRKNGLAPL